MSKDICEISYREEVTGNSEVFDWNKFLDRKKIDITANEWLAAKQLAGSWVTCACGNQCAIIPRNPNSFWDEPGQPRDLKLRDLGIEFMLAIDNENRRSAKSILKKIEARSTILINKILKQLKGTE